MWWYMVANMAGLHKMFHLLGINPAYIITTKSVDYMNIHRPLDMARRG